MIRWLLRPPDLLILLNSHLIVTFYKQSLMLNSINLGKHYMIKKLVILSRKLLQVLLFQVRYIIILSSTISQVIFLDLVKALFSLGIHLCIYAFYLGLLMDQLKLPLQFSHQGFLHIHPVLLPIHPESIKTTEF